MDGSMGGHAGNPETGALLHRHGFGQRDRLPQRNHGIFGGGAERTIRLRPVAPHASPQPLRWNAVPELIHQPGAIAMGNDAGVPYAVSKGVLALLDIPGIDAGDGNANPDFSWAGRRVRHLPNGQHFPCWPLLLVPCCSHGLALTLLLQGVPRQMVAELETPI